MRPAAASAAPPTPPQLPDPAVAPPPWRRLPRCAVSPAPPPSIGRLTNADRTGTMCRRKGCPSPSPGHHPAIGSAPIRTLLKRRSISVSASAGQARTSRLGTGAWHFLAALTVVQRAHMVEHVVQLAQVTVLGVADDDALGLLGYAVQFNGTQEWLHLGYNATLAAWAIRTDPTALARATGGAPHSGRHRPDQAPGGPCAVEQCRSPGR